MQQVSVDSWFLVLIRSVLKFIVGWIHIICSILINMRCKIKERTSSLCYFVGSQQRTIKVLSLHWIADRVLKFKVCNHHLNLITLILLFAYLFLPWKLKRQAWGKEFIIFQKFSRNIKSQILWKSPKTVKIIAFRFINSTFNNFYFANRMFENYCLNWAMIVSLDSFFCIFWDISGTL